MKSLVLGALVFLFCIGNAPAQNPAEIVRASRERITAETTQSRSRMVISAKNGATTERLIDQFSKDGPNGARKVIVFQKPATVANTRFLTLDNASGGSDQWIFLPALGRVRRIASNEGSGSFVGTDLSYDDVSSMDRKYDLDNHTLLRSENLNGRDCYVIQSIPKDSSYQYSKMIQWIDKENSVSYKVELYHKNGTHIKTLEILELKEVQGRLSNWRYRMSTLAAGTSTTVYTEILEYGKNIPERVFTQSYLETGSVR
jgi:outer membrane lipoprotein-sorting protein